MRRSRAGRTGGSWYGHHEIILYEAGVERRSASTNLERAKRSVRAAVDSGEADHGVVKSQRFEGGKLVMVRTYAHPKPRKAVKS